MQRTASDGEVATGAQPLKEALMGIVDKAKNAAEKATGKAKGAAGDATDNKDLKAEGKKDQTSGSAKQAGENVKDTFKS